MPARRVPTITGSVVSALLMLSAPAVAQTEAVRVAEARAARPASSIPGSALPRTADGKPKFDGVWQVRGSAGADLLDHPARLGVRAGRSVVGGGEIPYQPAAIAQKQDNFRNRQMADPLSQCFMPGVPRIMYLDFPFQIFQTPDVIAMTFEWSHVHRTIPTNGSTHPDGLEFWMGDSRGHWEGDTLVVEVTNHNDKTWFDMAGDFHSDALRVVERYTLEDEDTIRYEATIEDPKVFTKPWTITLPIYRRKDSDRIFEYVCQAEVEEASGAFAPDPLTWYQGPTPSPAPAMAASTSRAISPAPVAAARDIPRRPDGTPDLHGVFASDGGGANFGLERRAGGVLMSRGRGLITDPADGILPMRPWAKAERASRLLPERGYDDPTAHCFAAGVPRSLYVPQPFQIIQTADHVVFLFERMSWRMVPIGSRAPLPDAIRLWQGDSVGRWEGDTLVVETTNLNGKTWLNEAGEIVSHAERVVERFTLDGSNAIKYEATVTDPIVYTRPWTIAFPIKREEGELLEVACHEDDQDLAHLKAIRDSARAANEKHEVSERNMPSPPGAR